MGRSSTKNERNDKMSNVPISTFTLSLKLDVNSWFFCILCEDVWRDRMKQRWSSVLGVFITWRLHKEITKLQGVPHHIGPCYSFKLWFVGLIIKSKMKELFLKNCILLIWRNACSTILGFSSIMYEFWRYKLGDNLIWYGTLCMSLRLLYPQRMRIQRRPPFFLLSYING